MYEEGNEVTFGSFQQSHYSREPEAEIGLTSHEVRMSHEAVMDNG
jgi:hypothetical protein